MQIGLTRSLPALRRALIESMHCLVGQGTSVGHRSKARAFHGLGLLTVIIGCQCGDELEKAVEIVRV